MQAGIRIDPWWAALTVWAVVNAVNVLQAVGFLSRVWTGSRTINHLLGYAIVGFFLVYPLFNIFKFAVIDKETGVLSASNFVEFFGSAYYTVSFLNTLVVAVGGTLGAIGKLNKPMVAATEFLGGCGAFLTSAPPLVRGSSSAAVSTTRLEDLVTVARQFASLRTPGLTPAAFAQQCQQAYRGTFPPASVFRRFYTTPTPRYTGVSLLVHRLPYLEMHSLRGHWEDNDPERNPPALAAPDSPAASPADYSA